MKLQTTILKSALQKALKGAGYNTFMPITCFCRIKETKSMNKFEIYTTDGTNTLVVSDTTETEDTPTNPVDCVFDIKVFAQLINKTTSDYITIFTANNVMTIRGNGIYTMQLPLDENDRPIVFPEVVQVTPEYNTYEIYADIIRDIIRTNKPALSKTGECQELMGYVFADKVITTDSMVICAYLSNIYGHDVMFAPEVVNILSLFDDCITVNYLDDMYVFSDDTMIYYAHSFQDFDQFPLDAINNLLNTGFDNAIIVKATDLYDALDRIKLFISPYDSNTCQINFNDGTMTIKNQTETGIEKIAVDTDANYELKINIDFLMGQVKTMQDVIQFSFGNDSCIALADELTMRIIALQD